MKKKAHEIRCGDEVYSRGKWHTIAEIPPGRYQGLNDATRKGESTSDETRFIFFDFITTDGDRLTHRADEALQVRSSP